MDKVLSELLRDLKAVLSPPVWWGSLALVSLGWFLWRNRKALWFIRMLVLFGWGRMPLSEAVRLLASHPKCRTLTDFARGLNGSGTSEGTLNWLGQWVLGKAENKGLYGTKVPSESAEPIPSSEIRGFVLTDGASHLAGRWERSGEMYQDIEVPRTLIRQIIREAPQDPMNWVER